MPNSIDIAYFSWLCKAIGGSDDYTKLLSRLYRTKFFSLMELDNNRLYDGLDLRDKFAFATNVDRTSAYKSLSRKPCSVLEMMVALCIRCEEHIMQNEAVGDRTGQWFWEMIASLGLSDMVNAYYDDDNVCSVLDVFLNRRYEPDGRGGLFTIHRLDYTDMSNVEIWCQMMMHLGEME